jgi:hypothetical protein
VVQVSALAVGMLALVLLVLLRTDLIRSWQQATPADAPNRFVINVQPEQGTQFQQTLRDAGVIAPNSVVQFVANDIYFLGNHGVRSLRARDLSTTAAVSDVGSPVDNLFQDLLSAQGETYMAQAQAILSPRTGRFYLVLPDHIYVLSNYPSPHINAWARYDTPTTLTNAVFADPYIYFRGADNKLYRFGGTGAPQYDSSTVDVTLPYLAFDKPATMKNFSGIDVSCTGTWKIYAGLDPGNSSAEDLIATITGPTFLGGRVPFTGRSTHIRLRFQCTSATEASLSKVFIHYTYSDTD